MAGANAIDELLLDLIGAGTDPTLGLNCADLDANLDEGDQPMGFISGCTGAEGG